LVNVGGGGGGGGLIDGVNVIADIGAIEVGGTEF